MKRDILIKILQKPTFDSDLDEIVMTVENGCGRITTMDILRTRLTTTLFKFPIDGTWGLMYVKEIISSLKKMGDDVDISFKNNHIILKSGRDNYKIKLVSPDSVKTNPPITPSLDVRENICEVLFTHNNGQVSVAETLPLRFYSMDGQLKTTLTKHSGAYKTSANVGFDGKHLYVSGLTESKFEVSSEIDGDFVCGIDRKIKSTFSGLDELGKVLEKDQAVYLGNDAMIAIHETIDAEDIETIYVILPIIEEE